MNHKEHEVTGGRELLPDLPPTGLAPTGPVMTSDQKSDVVIGCC
jgi:hypothetical protein